MIMNNWTERVVYFLGVLAVVAVFGLALVQLANNPVEARHMQEKGGMELVAQEPGVSAESGEDKEGVDLSAVLTQSGRTKLWYPLVTPPPRPPSPPDWGKMFNNVTFTRNQIGVGDERQAQVITNPRSQETKWVKKGDYLNGARIREITDDTIVFEKSMGGRTFTHTVRRIQ